MIRWIQRFSFLATAFAFVMLVTAPGCTTSKDKDKGVAKGKDADKGKDKDKGGEHDHVAPHGGILAEWDPYHAELLVDHATKTATVYILDEKTNKAPKEEGSRFSKVKLTVTSEKPSVTIDFTHDAKKSGPEGIVFTATNDFFAKTEKFEGELTGQRDEGKKDVLPFKDTIKYEPKKK